MCRWMGSHVFGIWGGGGVNILASKDFEYQKYRTICGTNMRVKYRFYIQFNKCVNSF